VRAQAGAKLARIDQACQEHSGQELRLHPSTLKMGTIGGFVAGGSSGVGSITWGTLRDRGNILALRVVTLEAKPRVIELAGDTIQKVSHAYGSNGVITEVTMPLAPAWPWLDLIVGFPDFATALRFADALARQDGIVKKLITPLAAPIPELYFRPLQSRIAKGRSVLLLMIAAPWRQAFLDFHGAWPGEILLERAADDPKRRALPVYELSWNHTTLHALKIDPTVTYLQVLYPPPDHALRALALPSISASRSWATSSWCATTAGSRPSACRSCASRAKRGSTRSSATTRTRAARLQPARLHPRGGRHEAGRPEPSRLQARDGPPGPPQPRQDDRLGQPRYAGMSRQPYLYKSLEAI
jgi:hypothetical protein